MRRFDIFLPVLVMFGFVLSLPGSGQIRINEFCASNSMIIEDPDFADYADWVELYNAGNASVNLNGYYLTDNFGYPEKWQINTDAVIPSGGYLLIWADGMNTGLHASYKLSADGEEIALYTSSSVLVDSVSYSLQQADISMGRIPAEPGRWGYFDRPTPGSANTTPSYRGLVFQVPSFSVEGGMYSGQVGTEIESVFGGEVRFTTDGTRPTSASPLSTAPLVISSTEVVRARVFRPDSLPGPVITQSYFINENSEGGKLPVVSIATEPGNFWDPDTGIYVQDFKPEWEVPVNIELFENDGTGRAAFNQRAGIKVNGLYSWRLPQKMLGVYFRNAYGSGSLDYRLTPQRKRYSYKDFALRASGSDWSYTLFRDDLGQHSTLLNMDLEILGFRAAVVFVNGEYLGIHNIREKADADYIEKSYGLAPGSFDMVENQDYAEAGDLEAYNYFRTLLDKDLSVEANYQAVAELGDIPNFTDMLITEMATANRSIDHNVMAWKPKEGGKWRWLLLDLDRGFFDAPDHLMSFYMSQRQLLLRDLWANLDYREYLVDRLCSHLFTTFNADRVSGLIDAHAAAIESEIPRHIDRWEGTTSSYGNAMPSVKYWEDEVCDLKTFARERSWYLLADLENYDFAGLSTLILDTEPEEAGFLTVNGLKTTGPFSYGPFLMNREIRLEAEDRPGYSFQGWYSVPSEELIEAGATWRYNDTGTDPGPTWKDPGFDDGSWNQGEAELGYGDGDEATEINSGGSGNRNITTWFRKAFQVTAEQRSQGKFFIHLKKDDGAVVYLNGTEIARSNIRCNSNAGTTADFGLGGDLENLFITYGFDNSLLNEGENLIAVEVHQNAASSTDLSFSLALSCFRPDQATSYSADRNVHIQLTDEPAYLMAGYQPDGACLVPEVITGDLILSADCSPYRVRENVSIPEGASLTIEPGVEIRMPASGNFFIGGILEARGTSEQPVVFRKDPDASGSHWGGLVFRNTPGASLLQHVKIEDAYEGPDPLLEYAAVSAFHADLVMDHLEIVRTGSNPIVARFSDIVLTNSTLHSEVTGDLINVKYGNARIENCRFTGNGLPDTDAIDLDETGEGTVRNCRISGFYGTNSDAVDLGEEAQNVLVDSVIAWNITDKGVSVGQWSTAVVTNSIFVNCNLGVAVKDSSSATVRNCLFYSTGYPVACYEKNPGMAGGNAFVWNSILSNSSEGPYMSDSKSAVQIRYSLSDNQPLPTGMSNLLGNPMFNEPTYCDFSLLPSSPARMTGTSQEGPVNLGTVAPNTEFRPQVMISAFYINGSDLDRPQFIMLYNPLEETVNVSGYIVDKGVTAILPEDTYILPGGRLFVTDRQDDLLWDSTESPVIGWEEGHLSENGEALRLVNPYGIVADYFVYSDHTWPAEGFSGDRVFELTDPALDNHLPENWTTGTLGDLVISQRAPSVSGWEVYPNPTRGKVRIRVHGDTGGTCRVYTLEGRMLMEFPLNLNDETELDLTAYGRGVYLLKAGPLTHKIIVID